MDSTMKKIYFSTLILLLFCTGLVKAQNVDYNAYIYQFTSWETSCNQEGGIEEYTRKGWVEYEGGDITYSGCNECNNNGNCTSTGTWASNPKNNQTSIPRVRVQIDAWEDDTGDRCEFETSTLTGDDCRTATTSGWYNFPTPVEYQLTTANGEAGDANHKAYMAFNLIYSTTSLEEAVDNSTYTYSTGGDRSFWGSLGSWASNGGDCATSGTIGDNQTSSFFTTVSCIDQVSFQWSVSSESSYDFLRFYIDGVQQNSISGTVSWAFKTYALDPNIDHTLEWRYTKDVNTSAGDDRGFVDEITYNSYAIPTAGTNWGANTWNVAAYNGRDLDLAGVTYRGYYIENNLNINTQNHWTSGGTPSDAPSYDGCSVGTDNHTTVHRRQGFPCGDYRIDIAGHDDEIRIYVNGGQVFEHIGCCDSHSGVWSGLLNSSSTVEIRTAEGTGDSNTSVNFIDISPESNGGTITNNQTICSGTSPATLSSTGSAVGVGTITYQWQSSPNNSYWSNISAATGSGYNPPSLSQVMYYRRRATDQCSSLSYSNTLTIGIYAALNAGSISTNQVICSGTAPATLISTADASAGNGFSYQWQSSPNNSTWSDIVGASSNIYAAPVLTQNMYYRRRAISNCSETLYTNTVTITVQTLSTAPTPTPIVGKLCPNTNVALSASGGIAGTGSDIYWYSDAAGLNFIGNGSPIIVSTQTTTYYVRREGTCNTTSLIPLTVNVRDFVYTSVGATVSTGYCTDNSFWHHFYDASDQIICSLNGDLSGATSNPVITVTNNGSFYQTTIGAVGPCTSGMNPGEEYFELPRSWNVDFVGTLNPPYSVRYYFPATEKTVLETAAANFIAANPACAYTYKYSNPNGFYWFKNTGATYVPPLFDGPLHLTGSGGSANGMNYAEIIGITSFSGGSGAIGLVPNIVLPVELSNFSGKNQGLVNMIYWTTESELNNDYFELERMNNLSNGFKSITQVDGASTTNDTKNYVYVDESPATGVNYYRLKQVDFDGTDSYSKTIALEAMGDNNSHVFYPNPTKSIVTYQFVESKGQQLQIVMLNTFGQQVREMTYQATTGVNNVEIDLSDLPAGNYMVQVYREGVQEVTTEKITKLN